MPSFYGSQIGHVVRYDLETGFPYVPHPGSAAPTRRCLVDRDDRVRRLLLHHEEAARSNQKHDRKKKQSETSFHNKLLVVVSDDIPPAVTYNDPYCTISV